MEPLLALRSINFLASSSGLLKTSLYFIRCVSGTWKNIFDLQRHKPTHIHSSVKTAEINKRRRKTAFGEIFTPPSCNSFLSFVFRHTCTSFIHTNKNKSLLTLASHRTGLSLPCGSPLGNSLCSQLNP